MIRNRFLPTTSRIYALYSLAKKRGVPAPFNEKIFSKLISQIRLQPYDNRKQIQLAIKTLHAFLPKMSYEQVLIFFNSFSYNFFVMNENELNTISPLVPYLVTEDLEVFIDELVRIVSLPSKLEDPRVLKMLSPLLRKLSENQINKIFLPALQRFSCNLIIKLMPYLSRGQIQVLFTHLLEGLSSKCEIEKSLELLKFLVSDLPIELAAQFFGFLIKIYKSDFSMRDNALELLAAMATKAKLSAEQISIFKELIVKNEAVTTARIVPYLVDLNFDSVRIQTLINANLRLIDAYFDPRYPLVVLAEYNLLSENQSIHYFKKIIDKLPSWETSVFSQALLTLRSLSKKIS